MSQLPEGWVECSLDDVVRVQNGYAFPSKDFRDEGIPLIRQSNLAGDKVSLNKCVYLDPSYLQSKSDFILRKDDVLIGMSGSIGKLCIYDLDQPALQNQRTGKVVPFSKDAISWKFIWEYLKTIERQLLEKGKGLGILNVSADDIESLPLGLPPLAEQCRIVAKLETLLGKVDTCQQRLAKIPVILKRFRQAVLAAACSGELTVDWRELHQPSSPVLFADDEHVETDPTVETPGIWRWTTLSSLCEELRGICYGVIKLGAEVQNGIPCLRTSDVKPLRIDANDVKRIAPDISANYKRTILNGGEVLVNVRGTLGGVAVVPSVMKGWNISREVALAPLDPSVDAHFISFWIAAIHSQNWLSNVEKGVAYTGINLEDLRLLPVAIPSLSEQQEIVRRVETLFKIADQLEARYQKAKAQVDKLQQSILAKAFRGELVPTEAELARREGRDYEPASVLLERIRSERAEHGQGQKEKARSQPKPTRKRKGSGISPESA